MAKHVSYNPLNGCPVEAALDTLGGKWKGGIRHLLIQEPLRYSELLRTIPGVSERILTKQLKELEEDGLIHRELLEGTPLNVVYQLTPLGEELHPLIRTIQEWGENYLKQREG